MKDLMGLMKQAKQMQEKMLAGGGNMKSLKLDPSLFGSAEQDDMEMAEDLIIAAYQDAKVKLDEAQAKTMKDAMGDIPLPPGMNLPF
jgi:DNA-binding protein YbaB